MKHRSPSARRLSHTSLLTRAARLVCQNIGLRVELALAQHDLSAAHRHREDLLTAGARLASTSGLGHTDHDVDVWRHWKDLEHRIRSEVQREPQHAAAKSPPKTRYRDEVREFDA